MVVALMVGIGYDTHRLEAGESLVLGGVTLDSALGTVAHSDGDVAVHAIIDALLGAVALGDIGMHFPDTDPKWKGVTSLELLKHVRLLVTSEQVRIVNVDVSIILELPKLRPHIDAMRLNIAAALEIEQRYVSVKATTNERLGFVGRQQGIAAMAIAQVEPQS